MKTYDLLENSGTLFTVRIFTKSHYHFYELNYQVGLRCGNAAFLLCG
jgi:hypothetical protein